MHADDLLGPVRAGRCASLTVGSLVEGDDRTVGPTLVERERNLGAGPGAPKLPGLGGGGLPGLGGKPGDKKK